MKKQAFCGLVLGLASFLFAVCVYTSAFASHTALFAQQASSLDVQVTLQQGSNGYTGCLDTYIYQWTPDTNYCTADLLQVGCHQQFEGILRFDLASIPANVVVTHAALQVYSQGWDGENDIGIDAHYISRTVDLYQITWNEAQTGISWGIPGGNDPLTDRRATPEDSIMTTGNHQWYSFDLTAVVQGWMDGTLANNGVLLRSPEYPYMGPFYFASAENGEATLRPKLVLTYQKLPTQVAEGTDSAMVQTRDGKLWLVWGSSRSGNSDLWFKTSSNRGATWSVDTQLTTNPDNDLGPAITELADGRVWVVWYSRQPVGYDLWSKTSSDGGLTWSADVLLAATSLNPEPRPAIAQGADGKLWVAWADHGPSATGIWYRTSSDGGLTWSATTPLGTSGVSPAILQAADGKLWLVWSKPTGSGYYLVSTTSSDGGATWSAARGLTLEQYPPYALLHDDGLHPTLAQSKDGMLWLMWSSEPDQGDPCVAELWWKSSDDNGASWGGAQRWDRFAGLDYGPHLAALQDGSVAMTWTSDRTGRRDIWFGILGWTVDANAPPSVCPPTRTPTQTPTGTLLPTSTPTPTRTATPTVTPTPFGTPAPRPPVPVAQGGDPAMVQARDGRLWLVWSSSGDLWYRTSSDRGATWSAHAQLTTDPASDGSPAIIGLADGRLWVVWSSNRSGGYGIWHKMSSDGGLTWSVDTQLTATQRNPAITQAADGKLWVVWGGSGIWAKTSTDGGLTWSADTKLPVGAYYDPAILQAADGKLWLVWESTDWVYKGSRLLSAISSDGGVTWSDGPVLTPGGDKYRNDSEPSLVQASDGTLWLMWQSTPYSPACPPWLLFKTSSDKGVTWSGERSPSRSAGYAQSPALAALNDGAVALAYQAQASGPDIWVGIVGETAPLNPRPWVCCVYPDWYAHYSDDVFRLCAQVYDAAKIDGAYLVWARNGTPQTTVPMSHIRYGTYKCFGGCGGNYYVEFGPFAAGSEITFQVRAVDDEGDSVLVPSSPWSFTILAPDLHFDPDSKKVNACTGSFTVELQAQDVRDLEAFEVSFAFDPDIVQVTSIAPGSLIIGSERPFTIEQQIDNVLGQVSLDATSSRSLPAPSGSGSLVVITLSPVQTGTTTLALQQVQLTDTGEAIIPAVSQDGSVTILPGLYGDLDCDCDVDIVDIMLVASRWGTALGDPRYDVRYDLDSDGDIDIVDIMRAATHWGELCASVTLSRGMAFRGAGS